MLIKAPWSYFYRLGVLSLPHKHLLFTNVISVKLKFYAKLLELTFLKHSINTVLARVCFPNIRCGGVEKNFIMINISQNINTTPWLTNTGISLSNLLIHSSLWKREFTTTSEAFLNPEEREARRRIEGTADQMMTVKNLGQITEPFTHSLTQSLRGIWGGFNFWHSTPHYLSALSPPAS